MSGCGEGEDAVLGRRIPPPSHHHVPRAFVFSPSEMKATVKFWYNGLFFGEWDFGLPYGFDEHHIKARESVEDDIPFDLTKRNFYACRFWYNLLQKCADGTISKHSKKKCPEWMKLYMCSCVPEQQYKASPPKKTSCLY